MKFKIPEEIFGKPVKGAMKRVLVNNTSNDQNRQTTDQSSPLTEGTNFRFLERDKDETVLEEYNQRISKDYKGASALKVLSFADNVLKGSNPFAFVLLNKILRNRGEWVARQVDLEKCLRENALDLKGTYGDSGLVLRSDGEPNQYLARDLINQVKQKGSLQYPLMIPLEELDLRYDANSPHNLSFQLTGLTELIYTPQLDKANHLKKFNHSDEKGLPVFEDSGSRTLYSNEAGGLCRLVRDRDLDLYARGGSLAGSVGGGRVIVCAEGTSPKN